MCKPARTDPLEEIGRTCAAALTAAGRATMRLACCRFSDEAVERGRWLLARRWPLFLAATTALTWWLGRPAAFVTGGAAVVVLWLGHGLAVEQARRSELRPTEPVQRPETPEQRRARMRVAS